MQDLPVDHNRKKHPCPDCTFCQWCSDDRCRLCRGGHSCRGKKLSLAEQVALYDEINRTVGRDVPSGDMTADRIASLGLEILQPRNGYRFSIDSLLLARFAEASGDDLVVDLGTGCGVIALVCARLAQRARFVAVERQPALAGVARRNVTANGLDERIEVVEGDLLEMRKRYAVSTFDLVVSNPPFRKAGCGRPSPNPERDCARRETTASLEDFLSVAKYLVKPSGRICFIHPADRLQEFFSVAGGLGLSVTRIRTVHGRVDLPARMVLYELVKGRDAQIRVLPPLIIRDDWGETADTLWLAPR